MFLLSVMLLLFPFLGVAVGLALLGHPKEGLGLLALALGGFWLIEWGLGLLFHALGWMLGYGGCALCHSAWKGVRHGRWRA
jgi:hypothetical protein